MIASQVIERYSLIPTLLDGFLGVLGGVLHLVSEVLVSELVASLLKIRKGKLGPEGKYQPPGHG